MQFKFHPYKELATGDGFNYPIDVNYDTVFLGTLIAEPDGFIIAQIDSPHGKQTIKQTPHNKFKSLNIASEVLHRAWKQYRHGGDYGAGETVLKEDNNIGKYWWMDPNGDRWAVPKQEHNIFAAEYVSKLVKTDPRVKMDDVYGSMYNMGWIRLAMFGYMGMKVIHFNLNKSRKPNSKQKDGLIQIATEYDVSEIVDGTNGGVYADAPYN